MLELLRAIRRIDLWNLLNMDLTTMGLKKTPIEDVLFFVQEWTIARWWARICQLTCMLQQVASFAIARKSLRETLIYIFFKHAERWSAIVSQYRVVEEGMNVSQGDEEADEAERDIDYILT